MILVEEHEKHEYGLNQEEFEVLEQMKAFGQQFCRLWAGGEGKGASSAYPQPEGSQIVAKLRTREFSDNMKGV